MESLRGRLLIASPAIQDPSFRQSVVLLAEHTEEGAMGVVLNRESTATVGDVVPSLAELAGEDAPVFVGGPVSGSSVTVVAQFAEPGRAALLVHEDVGFVPAGEDDRAALHAGLLRTRVFAGHAGWGPGQLEAEMEEESWIVEEPLTGDLFTEDPEGLWSRILRRKGGGYVLISTMPPDPGRN